MMQLLDNVLPSTFQECTQGKNSKNHKTKTNYTTNQNSNSGTFLSLTLESFKISEIEV